jgi:GNAT superfamily N-acetyltransferase
MADAQELTVVQVSGRRALRDWIRLPHRVYAGDPCWVPPLDVLERFRFSHRHAAVYALGDAQLFLAYRDGRPVGRVSAHYDRRYREVHGEDLGAFGFFECLDDPEAAQALLSTAASWLRERGKTRMRGPLNFSTNEECGCLISGFDTPPAVLMPHGRPWTAALLEGAGFTKEMDLYAYRVRFDALNSAVAEVAGLVDPTGVVTIRPYDPGRHAQEIDVLVEIFNDAWSANWGFLPIRRNEIDELISRVRWLVRENCVWFGAIGGKTAAVAVALPNFNEVIAPFGGRLLPFNWAKLVWKFWSGDVHSGRISLLGVRREYQSTPLAGAFLAQVVGALSRQAQRYRVDWMEFSWVLETNRRMMALAQRFAGPPVKTYRIFSKPI